LPTLCRTESLSLSKITVATVWEAGILTSPFGKAAQEVARQTVEG
jgi:hypothetical protein